MLFRAAWWCVLLLLGFVSAHAVESVSRKPPTIYAKQIAPLLTPIEKALAARAAFPDAKTNGIVLLDEMVHFRDDAGVNYVVFHDIWLARSNAAEKVMGNRIYSFDREHDSIFLISAATIGPDGKRQELGERAAFIQSPQREADNGLYTSEQELNLIFPNIAAGAVTEAIVLIREDKPVFPGEFASSYPFALGWPVAQFRLVADFPAEFMKRVHAVKSSEQAPEPQSQKLGKRTRHTWSRELVKEIDWEASGPELRFRAPTVWLTTLDSWDQVTAWFSELAASRTTLGPELEKNLTEWTRGLTDRRAIVDRLASIVANDVRYTGLEFGLAGYQPYPCEKVWANRYGDCKDKANLLRALLARQGIASHFLLLKSGGLGRVEKRSPSWKQFNHVILAIEDGAGGLWYRDTTLRHLPPDHLPVADAARDVLLVRGGKAEWQRTPDPLQNAIHVDADLALAPTGELSGWFTLSAVAGDAAAYTEFYNERKPVDRRRALEETIGAFYPGAEVIDVDYTPVEGSVTDFKIRGFLLRKPAADTLSSFAFAFPASWLPEPGDAQQRRFPYGTRRRTESFHARITLPAGWNASQLPAPVRIQSDSIQITAEWQGAAGALEQNLRWAPGAAELSPTDYAVFERALRTLRTWLAQPAPLAQTTAVATSSPAAQPSPDFPLLPSGAGQIRLLDERFPSGQRDVERRAALRQVLQWFPDDADTVLTARVYAALIDHKDNDATLARTITDAMNELGPKVPAESLAWARYLAARSRWTAAKDPAAIRDLEAIAADTSLSTYRRSWSAFYAARFHSETDLPSALKLLAQWDVEPSDPRDSILKLEAELLARAGDATVLSAWARRLLAREDADHLFAIALGALESQPVGDGLAAVPRVLTPLLQPADRFAETLPALQRLRTRTDAARLRTEFVSHLDAWIAAHPRPWIMREKSPQFADLAALEKHLDAMNDAHNAEATIDGVLQLVRFHECDYEKFAKYLYWAAWWLESRKLDLELLAFLARETHPLPNDNAENIGEVWFRYAAAARAAGKLDDARAEYRTIVTLPNVRPFQRVEAHGELGLLEIDARQFEEARAAFAAAAEEHSTHKKGSEYLFVATMLALEQHEWDRALDYIGKIAATEKEYRNATKHAEAMGYLLQSSGDPVALRRYWEQTVAPRRQWDELLAAHQIEPEPLPLFEHITELQQEIGKAADAKDTSAYVRNLDLLVRTALYVPIYAINACNQMNVAARFDPELQRELFAFVRPVVRAFPVGNDASYWSARLWEAALLTDSRPPRLAEAATAARKLYFENGPGDGIKLAALLLWLNATANTSDEESIQTATALLSGSTKLQRRAELVSQLANSLTARHRPDEVRALLIRETQHPDVLAQTSVANQLKTQLTTLQRDGAQASAFTRDVNAWLHEHSFDYLLAMPPRSLEHPRYGTPGPDAIYEGGLFPPAEQAKCNLLLALDETKPIATRHRAFASFYHAVASRLPRADDLAALAPTVANLPSLPENVVYELSSITTAFLLRNGHPDAAEKFLDSVANTALRDRLRKTYGPLFTLSHALVDYTPERARQAFDGILAAPVGSYEASLLRALLARTVDAGDTELATQLVESASRLQPAPNAGQSAAGFRLDLLRHVRRESAHLPLHRRVGEILARHFAPTPEDRRAAAALTTPYVLNRVADHATRARLVAAIFLDHLFPETARSEIINQLHSATSAPGRSKVFGPELTRAILTAPELDDQALARWLMASRFADFDLPDIRAALTQQLQACLARPEVKAGSLAPRIIHAQLADIALRTSEEKRPEAIFGPQVGAMIPPPFRQILELNFNCTRGDIAAATALAAQLDADQLSAPEVFLHVRPLLAASVQTDELNLLQNSALEKFERNLPELWFNDRAFPLLHAAYKARELGATHLLPDALFTHIASVQTDAFDRAVSELARAVRDRDWKAQATAADRTLAVVPDFYELVYFRGEARFHLGNLAGARSDLEIFVRKALDSSSLPEARRMLAECK